MKIKSKYYKETEYLLYNYEMFKIAIENMKKEIEFIKLEDGTKGISYNGISTSPTNEFKSITEDTALSKIEKIDYLNHSIRRIENKIDRIDRAIGGLTEVERNIIKDKYMRGKQWYTVAYNVSYSERHCRNFRRNAIGKIAIGIFGNIATSLPHLDK